MTAFTESIVEEAGLDWLARLGYAVLHGPDIAAGEPGAERNGSSYRDTVLEPRLRAALARLNPELPVEALDDAYRKLMCLDAPSSIERNRAVHRMLVDGITVESAARTARTEAHRPVLSTSTTPHRTIGSSRASLSPRFAPMSRSTRRCVRTSARIFACW